MNEFRPVSLVMYRMNCIVSYALHNIIVGKAEEEDVGMFLLGHLLIHCQ
jgi:hypothetical protein